MWKPPRGARSFVRNERKCLRDDGTACHRDESSQPDISDSSNMTCWEDDCFYLTQFTFLNTWLLFFFTFLRKSEVYLYIYFQGRWSCMNVWMRWFWGFFLSLHATVNKRKITQWWRSVSVGLCCPLLAEQAVVEFVSAFRCVCSCYS